MRPDDDSRRCGAREIRVQRRQRVGHMAIAQIPRRDAAAKHLSIIFLSVFHHACVLHGIEALVARRIVGVSKRCCRHALHFRELRDRRILARSGRAETRCVGIALAIAIEAVEAGVIIARLSSRVRIDAVEITYDGVDGRVKAVKIESVESDFASRIANAVVVPAQPFDERQHVGVAPHPRRKACEAPQCVATVRFIRGGANVAIETIRIGPIRFDCDAVKSVALDQRLRDARAFRIKIVRAV